jgi:diaminopimelate decarboxylase
MIPTLREFFSLASDIDGIAYLNIGGGIGVNYSHVGPDFDVFRFGNALSELVLKFQDARSTPLEVIIEPGRGIAARCGVFVTTVTDIKTLHGTRYVATDGSVAVFPRPFHHPESAHCVRPLRSLRDGASLAPAKIVGRTTFSRDILGSANLPNDLMLGELLLIEDAGAYSQSMMSRFLGQPDPATVFLGNQGNDTGTLRSADCTIGGSPVKSVVVAI